MEETFCDACGIHFPHGRKHFYEKTHKARINNCAGQDIEAISSIKEAIDGNSVADLTKHFIHCRYCECPEINRTIQATPFSNKYRSESGITIERWSNI